MVDYYCDIHYKIKVCNHKFSILNEIYEKALEKWNNGYNIIEYKYIGDPDRNCIFRNDSNILYLVNDGGDKYKVAEGNTNWLSNYGVSEAIYNYLEMIDEKNGLLMPKWD